MSIPEMKHFTEHSKKIYKSVAYEIISWSGLKTESWSIKATLTDTSMIDDTLSLRITAISKDSKPPIKLSPHIKSPWDYRARFTSH